MAVAVVVDELPPGASPPITDNWLHSVCQLTKFECEWTIHQYELRAKRRVESTEFTAAEIAADYMTWSLILDEDGILLRQRVPGSKCRQGTRVKTAFLNARREKVFSNSFVVGEGMATPTLVNFTTSDKILKSKDLIVNGNLTIFCLVETYVKEKKLAGQTAKGTKPLDHKEDLNDALEVLFQSMNFSDVTFNVRGQRFRAHKTLLAARSEVFAAMFQHFTKEHLTGVVDVPDVEPVVFKELLRYIYTGLVPLQRMDEVAVGLLAAADKYLLGKLKKACGDHLATHISPENCVKLLSLGKNDVGFEMKQKAVDYIRKFPAEVTATDGWKKASVEKAEWFVSVKDKLFDCLVRQSKATQ